MRPKIAISYEEEALGDSKRTKALSNIDWADIEWLDPYKTHEEELRNVDMYHMAKRRLPSLCDLKTAEDLGIPTVNAWYGAKLADDRLMGMVFLKENSINVPITTYGKANGENKPPLVIKSRFESLGPRNIQFQFGRELDFQGMRVMQDYLEADTILKTYVIGDHIRTVECEGPACRKRREINPSEEIEALAKKISRLTGLRFMGMDTVSSDGEFHVVDFNSVGSLREVNDGPRLYENLLKRIAETEIKNKV